MTPRESDRYEELSKEVAFSALDGLLVQRGVATSGTDRLFVATYIAAALRAEREAALNEAAQDISGELLSIRDSQMDSKVRTAYENAATWARNIIAALASSAASPGARRCENCAAGNHDGCHARSLGWFCACVLCASPAAAPAAEPCPEPPPGLVETLEKVHGMGCGNIATHRIPAPPPDPVAPSLLPRVLAALEHEENWPPFQRLAAELRRYIATDHEAEARKWRDVADKYTLKWDAEKVTRVAAEKRIAELETAIRWACGEGDEFPTRQPSQGAYWWRTELRRRAALADGG